MAKVRRTILGKGYFPKELPPTFFTEHFALYASSHNGRKKLDEYSPPNRFTECVGFELAQPGGGRRPLGIPHPATYSSLAGLVAQSLSRLLKKAARSKCARSRPVFRDNEARAIRTMVTQSHRNRERAIVRGAARYLLKIDVSQFYPTLYIHAIGWALDPQLRLRANWGEKGKRFLGRKIESAMMESQGRISHGIPIGTDISFLLAEIVLAQVDSALKLRSDSAYRWYDDYEVACDSVEEAERVLARLHIELAKFRLKVNQSKTKIVSLPDPTLDAWQTELIEATRTLTSKTQPTQMLAFFDRAFRLRSRNPDDPVLNYALGLLFRLRVPSSEHVGRIALSCITQAVLAEPGSAQKAFALLTFWSINGFGIDQALVTKTIDQVVLQQRHRGLSSDVSWSLYYAVQFKLALGKKAADALAACPDNCIALQALHLKSEGLLPKTYASKALSEAIKTAEPDGRDWLLLYEAHRQKFATPVPSCLANHSLFGDMLARDVGFYRPKVPNYAALIQPGGAPEWVVRAWMRDLLPTEAGAVEEKPPEGKGKQKAKAAQPPIVSAIGKDVRRLGRTAKTLDQYLAQLLDSASEKKPDVGEDGDAGIEY